MPDLMANGLDWLSDQLVDHVSQAVVYSRGADSAALRATIGKTDFEIVDAGGFGTRFTSRDYLIRAADLILGGVPVEPDDGDRIVEAGETYEVMRPGDGVQSWRWSDPHRKILRVHTKRVVA